MVNSPPGRNDSGRIEICVNEDWSTVCDMGWNNVDARVACRQLGFSRYGEAINTKVIHSFCPLFFMQALLQILEDHLH